MEEISCDGHKALDTISRQAAIDAVEYWHGVDASEALGKVPSAQPTQINADPMQGSALDCVRRQQAIDAVKSYWKSEVDRIPKKSTDFDVFTQICDSILSHNANICKAIDQLPSAQPERKKGTWEKDELFGEDAYVCTYCETIWTTGQIKNMHYCPTCGADMRGDGDETD